MGCSRCNSGRSRRPDPAPLAAAGLVLEQGAQLLGDDLLEAVGTHRTGQLLAVAMDDRPDRRRKEDRLVDRHLELHLTERSALPRILNAKGEALLIMRMRVALNRTVDDDGEWPLA